jgi:CO/xanthine dehydrogenase Mo-binding subunit
VSERRPASPSLKRNPDLDTWIRIETDGTVTVFTGKVEIGQSIRTAIARIAAEELDLELEQVRVQTADTGQGPDEIITAGSMSIEHSGAAVRAAAAEARQVLLQAAAERLGAPLASLEVRAGTIRAAGGEASVTYGELQGGKPFERKITGEARPKAPGTYRIVGKPGPRIDLEAKVRGGAFVQDLRPEGTVFGRVLRPPSYDAELRSVDLDAVRALPGVLVVVRDGRFLGVVAEREEQALRAREALEQSAQWSETASLPADRELHDWLVEQPRESFPVVNGTPEERPVEPHRDPRGAALTHAAEYSRPFILHGALGPSAALARFEPGELTVWSHSQSITLTRLAIAKVMGLEADAVRLIHADGAGCYGHNAADDAALDAALLARALPGRPVLLQWTREDEHTWEPLGSAMRVDLRGSLDTAGRIIDWSHDVYSLTHVGRPLPGDGSQLAAAWHLETPFERPPARPRLGPEVGIHRNAHPYYAFPRKRVVKHLVLSQALRTSSLRGLGAYANVFAIESFMDELAHEAGADPVEFRLRHLDDARARAVVEAAAERAGWGQEMAQGSGRGIAFARYENSKAYCAVVVDLDVDGAGAIQLRRAVIAGDAGQIVDPSGLANQLEGGFVQSASWTLFEQVRFNGTRITSRDWDSYPILGFADVPEIDTVLLDRPEEPFLGAGEASQGPAAAAIANAVFQATGRRLRRTPFTPR